MSIADKLNFISSRWLGPPARCEPSVARWAEGQRGAAFELIREPRRITRTLPTRLDGEVHDRFREEQSAMTDPVFLACIPDARVWGDPNVAVITPDDAVLAELSNVFGRPADKHPVFQRRRLGPVRTLNGTSLLLAATEGRRYFHWMMDVLPRVETARQHYALSEFDHIITNPITSSFQRETLEAVGIDLNRVVETRSARQLKCAELVAPSLPRGNGQTPEWAIDFLRSAFAPEESSGTGRRIYVSRRDAERRRVRNEREVTTILRQYGFETFEPVQHTVSEQAARMAGTTHVIAPHGGGLTNVTFCRPNVRVWEVFPSANVKTHFWQIANILGSKYSYTLANEEIYGAHLEEFCITKSVMKKIIDKKTIQKRKNKQDM
jgi:capsular polysaccharide biosynthesis protein